MTTVFKQRPYFDDFDENKKFLSIISRPSYPLQAREFTQVQSILQNQIERLGNHLFKDGAKITDGNLAFDTGVYYVKLSSTNRIFANLVGLTLTGALSGAKATVVAVVDQTENDPPTMYVRFVSSDTSTNSGQWIAGESIVEYSDVVIENSDDAIGYGSIAEITRGIYYFNGYFLLVDPQTIILDKYSNTPSYRVGLQVNESVVTPEQDNTLLDNAIGSYNYAAPGAHRYKVELKLVKVPLSSSTNNDNFIELGQIRAGQIVKQTTTTEYNTLAETLARRTYDESGDYTVRPFKLAVREHRSNDRGQWRRLCQYYVGDIVKNNGTSYVARNDGVSSNTSGPDATYGTATDGDIMWEVTTNPTFNNGVFPAEGHVTSIDIIDGGNGYVTPPDVVITSNSGSGATAQAVVADGKVIDIVITNSGSGYLYGDVNVQLVGGLGTTGEICYTVNGTESRNVPVAATVQANTDAGDRTKLAIGLESGKAYVRGYEIEKLGTTWIAVDKARTLGTANNVFLTPSVGNYFKVTNIYGAPPLSTTGGGNAAIVSIYDRRIGDDHNPAGNKIGTARVRAIEWDSGTPHDSNNGIYKLYVYDVKLDNGVSLANKVKSFYSRVGQSTFACNVSCELSELTGNITSTGDKTIAGSGTSFTTEVVDGDYIYANGNYLWVEHVGGQQNITTDSTEKFTNVISYRCSAQLYDPQGISAVYPLPNTCVCSTAIDELDYTTTEYLTSSTQSEIGSTLVLTFVTNSGDAVFANPDETDNLILFDNTSGEIVKFTTSGSTSTSNTIQLSVDSSLRGHSFTLEATIRRSGRSTGRCSKTTTHATTIVTDQASVEGSIVYLGHGDGYRLTQVRMYNGISFGETPSADSGYVDITSRYQLVSGQTDSYYGESYIRLNSGYNVPTGPIAIEFDYFEHGQTGDYFTVDSYDVPYEDIPSYNGLSLRDAIDFRPTIIRNSAPSKIFSVKRGTEIEISYQYYLGRKDKICLDYGGEFSAVAGVPATNPQLPETPNMSLNLYNLDIQPYTFGTTSSDVGVNTIDNRRYTMRDIGKLEQRISNLEQYTALSLLETQTESMQITDSDGYNRYKQGFVVDNFQSPLVVNDNDPNARCSIDTTNSICRPTFTNRNVSLFELVKTGGRQETYRNANNYKLYGKIFTLPLDPVNPHIAVVQQNQASRIVNVNPYAVATFIGSMSINPATDDWYETEYLPDIVTSVEGNYLSTKSALEGTVWNSWQTTWTGQSYVSNQTESTVQQAWNQHIQNGNIFESSGYLTTIKTTTSKQVGQSRTGVKTTVTATTDYEQVGDRLVSTSTIPYLRSRWLLIRASGLKPYTRYYPYFDNVAVDYWCVPASRIDYTYNGTNFDGTSGAGSDATSSAREITGAKYSLWPELTDRTALDVGDVITGRTTQLTAVVVGVTRQPTHNDPNTIGDSIYVVNIKNRDGEGCSGRQYNSDGTVIANSGTTFNVGETIDATNSISGAYGVVTYAEPNLNHQYDQLITNASGELYFMFWIPDNDLIDYTKSENVTPVFQFRCGDRVFAVSDSSEANNANAEAVYSATGILNTRQKSINAIRNAVVTKTTVSENRTITQSTTTTSYKFQPVDPLAQTFNVPLTGGCFLSKVDIYFATKPSNDNPLPIRLQIRTCENGIPTQTVLPFSEVSLRPDQVNISTNIVEYLDDDGNKVTTANFDTPTTFEFETPVYVDETTEYAIVLLSDSNDYNVWVAHVGDNVPGQESIVSKQPYTGTLLKSQNASTWTPDQNEDLMFTVYRANFYVADNTTHNQIIGNVQFVAANPQPDQLDDDPFETVAGSGIVRVNHPFHGLLTGMVATINRQDINDIDTTNLLSGTITTSTTTPTVYGTSTNFTRQLQPSQVLYVSRQSISEQPIVVGTIKTIVSDSELTLESTAAIDIVDATYLTEQQGDNVNGIPVDQLIGNHQVIQSDINSYIIDLTSRGYTATTTGYGGGKYWTSVPIYNYDLIQPSITTQSFSATGLQYSIEGLTGTSSGSFNPLPTGTLAVTANENNTISQPLAIWDEANKITSDPSLIVNVEMTSSNPCLTPMIDSERVSAILINNVINNPTESTVNNSTLDRLTIANGEDNDYGYYGQVTNVSITNFGANYQSAIVTFSEPTGITVDNGGVTATGTAEINNGRITAINVTNPGIGYIEPPTITITGTPIANSQLTTATATCQLLVNEIVTTSELTTFTNAAIGKYLDIVDNGVITTTTLIIDKYTTDQISCLYTDTVFTPTTTVSDQQTLVVRTRYVDEIAPRDGSVYSKYITKPITLSGTSTMIKVMFGANVPNKASIDVYYKTYINGGSDQYDDVPWTKFTNSTSIAHVDVGDDTFTDVEYSAENVPAFDVVAIKVVFRSSDSSQIPRIRDFRTICVS